MRLHPRSRLLDPALQRIISPPSRHLLREQERELNRERFENGPLLDGGAVAGAGLLVEIADLKEFHDSIFDDGELVGGYVEAEEELGVFVGGEGLGGAVLAKVFVPFFC